jgi:sterol desaturase/sphingolipid hydroxylase (fatty acid hydroxylase superfamily)
MRTKEIPPLVSAALVFGALGTLLWLERRRPLRQAVEPQGRRDLRNLAVAACGAAALRLAEKPVVEPLARRVEERRRGLLKQLSLPAWIEVPLAVLLMDYTLYLWHVLTHKVPFIWRFHVVHHADLDLSASTALLFHFGELLLSVPWRAAQIALIGVSPLSLSLWRTFTFLSILFHHSNFRLPAALERRLVRFVVTPRMHGIHHSTVPEETGSNWSSGFTIWDRLHGTLRLDLPQPAITIGVPAYRAPEELTFGRALALPFREQRSAWRLPDGSRPRRMRGGRRAAPGNASLARDPALASH